MSYLYSLQLMYEEYLSRTYSTESNVMYETGNRDDVIIPRTYHVFARAVHTHDAPLYVTMCV